MASIAADTTSLKWVLHFILLLSFPFLFHSIYGDYSTANLSTTWTIDPQKAQFLKGSRLMPILINKVNYVSNLPTMGFGFFTINGTLDSFCLVIFASKTSSDSSFTSSSEPQVLWSANRDKPVKQNATLGLTLEGDLILRDSDNTIIWSTNTSGKFVAGMNITATGNLVLFDSKNTIVWQSLDHPTDTWLPWQKLKVGQSLISSVSTSNLNSGRYYLSVLDDGLYAFIESNPSQVYSRLLFHDGRKSMFLKNLTLDIPEGESNNPISVNYTFKENGSFQYMKLDSDGHLRVYQWDQGLVNVVDDMLTSSLGDCLNNCSCKADLFQCHGNASFGNWSLPSQFFFLMTNREEIVGYNSTTFVKFQSSSVAPSPNSLTQNSPSESSRKKSGGTTIIVGSVLETLVAAFLIFIIWCQFFRK